MIANLKANKVSKKCFKDNEEARKVKKRKGRGKGKGKGKKLKIERFAQNPEPDNTVF